jgi:hypothetical protein
MEVVLIQLKPVLHPDNNDVELVDVRAKVITQPEQLRKFTTFI